MIRTALILAATLLPASAYAGGPDPILRYTFDDATNPTANSGTLGSDYDAIVGTGIAFTAFAGGFAIDKPTPLDQQTIPMGDENILDIADGDFTIVATVMTSFEDLSAPGGRFIITKNSSGNEDGWILAFRPDTGKAQFNIADGSTSINVLSCTPINDGAPHTILGVRSGDRVALYVDGVLHASGDIPMGFGSTTDNNQQLHIGGRSSSFGPTGGLNDEFVGLIDNVELYDVALIDPPLASIADLAPSYGIFDFSDVIAFLQFFGDEDPRADLAPPSGVWDFSDVIAFLTAFGLGCS